MQNITIKKEDYFKMLSENIIIKEIYIKNKIKNYDLLKNLIKLLAMTNKLLSAREIHKILNYNKIAVSHITVIEYLDYILKSDLVRKIYRFDLKLNNKST
jgi:predicted AAA+ superfamily ATPase